jgi:hypothetical protein
MNCFCRSSGTALVVAGMLIGCKADGSRPAGQETATPAAAQNQPSTVEVVTKDYAFDAPDTLQAGLTTIHLKNEGKELHHAQLIKLEEGKTLSDVAQALKNPGPPPSWVKFVAGPNAVPGGKEANATAVLEPGNYAWICFVYGPDMVMHAAKGMAKEVRVTGAAPTAAKELPPADVTIRLVDYGFEPSGPITPGRRTILVENAGPQVHELALLKLAPGKSVKDFGIWAETGMKGPPPAEPIGGVVLLDKGGRGTFTADLEPGTYGLICFVPDSKDGKPHLAHGMVREIKVG